jgi:spermidine synthase
MSSSLGNHILVEFTGCSPEIMNDVASIERDMVEAAVKAEMTVINSTFHHFSPYGVSGVVVVQESHLAIHTWPEYGYAAVDIFTCGETNTWAAFDYLQEKFQAKNYSAIEMRRGVINLLERMDFDLSSMRSQASERQNPGKYTRDVWFTDKDDNQALSLKYTGEILYRKQSPFQRVSILETTAYGKMLTLDNMVMCTEKDEMHYHEMISHPAILAHKNVKNVLVIGGGDGGTVREILKHKSVEKVTMVEIDGLVVEACKEFLPSISCELDNPKLDLKIADGIAFVANAAPGTYDLVIVDGSDPVGPAEGLFTEKFYQDCYNSLNENGILVAQGESPMFNSKVFVELNQCLSGVFGAEKVKTLMFYVPTYPTGMWSFQTATKGSVNVSNHLDEAFIENFTSTNNLNYYNIHIHKAAFALPNFVKTLLEEEVTA